MREGYLLRRIRVGGHELPFVFGQLIYDYREESGHVEVVLAEMPQEVRHLMQPQDKFKVPVDCLTQEFYRIGGNARCFQSFEQRYQFQFPLKTKLNKEAFELRELMEPLQLVEIEYQGKRHTRYLANVTKQGDFLAVKDPDSLRIELFPAQQVKLTLLDTGLKE